MASYKTIQTRKSNDLSGHGTLSSNDSKALFKSKADYYSKDCQSQSEDESCNNVNGQTRASWMSRLSNSSRTIGGSYDGKNETKKGKSKFSKFKVYENDDTNSFCDLKSIDQVVDQEEKLHFTKVLVDNGMDRELIACDIMQNEKKKKSGQCLDVFSMVLDMLGCT